MLDTTKTLSHLILTITPVSYMLHPNFTNEETEDSRQNWQPRLENNMSRDMEVKVGYIWK